MRNGIEYFVFSTAGKLVFASHQSGDGEDEDGQASTRVGVLQTLISIYADDAHDRLRHISLSDSLSIVFLLRPPLYLTAISHHTHGQPPQPPALLRIHLDALHLQLTSIVPAPKLNKLYAQRPNYDLRARMLTGTEPFLHSLIGSLQQSHPPSSSASAIGTEGGWPWLLGALQPIKLDPSLRAKLGQALQPPALSTSASASPTLNSTASTAASTLSLLNPVAYLTTPSSSTAPPVSRPKDLLYVLVLFRSQLVTLLRPRKHSVHAADMHLLINAARASIRSRSKAERSPTESAEETAAAALAEDLISWVPVCLPRFAAGGYVWAHVSLLPKSGARPKTGAASPQSSLLSSATAASSSRPPTPGQGPTTGSRASSGLPTHHVSTATAVSFSPAASSSTTSLHVPDSSTAQAVASAMRSSLRSASTSRASSPLPSPLLSSAASSFPSSPLIPSSSSSSSSGSASQDPDQTIKADDRASESNGENDDEAGDRTGTHPTNQSETASLADSDTPSHSQGREHDVSTMDEAQEAELMASISALRSGPVTPLPTPGVEGKQPLVLPPGPSDAAQDAEAAEKERRRKANYFAENLEEEDDLTLVLVSGDPDAFSSLSLWRNHIISTLQSSSILSQLLRKLNISAAPASTAGPAKSSYSADELRIPGLRHFIYKSRTATQLTAPRYEAPYVSSSAGSPTSAVDAGAQTQEDSNGKRGVDESTGDSDGGDAWRRLTGLYGLVWDGIHAPQPPTRDMFGLKPARQDSDAALTSDTADVDESAEKGSSDTPSSGQYHGEPPTLHTWASSSSSYAFVRTEHEAVLGWLTSAFELYICVSPWIRRKAVTTMANKVAKWVKDKEEELFLVAPPVF